MKGYIVTNVPRKKGISGFYLLTMLVGLLYFTSFIQDNKVFSTLLIGISRVFSGTIFFIIKSQCQLFDWLLRDISICDLNSVNCHRIDWRFGIVGCYRCSFHCPTRTIHWIPPDGTCCSFCRHCNHPAIFP